MRRRKICTNQKWLTQQQQVHFKIQFIFIYKFSFYFSLLWVLFKFIWNSINQKWQKRQIQFLVLLFWCCLLVTHVILQNISGRWVKTEDQKKTCSRLAYFFKIHHRIMYVCRFSIFFLLYFMNFEKKIHLIENYLMPQHFFSFNHNLTYI